MTILTAADYADTGQWRLVVKISEWGMSAWLENTLHDDLPAECLFTTGWEPDSVSLLHNIENAVYDHPRVLDDFSAKIVVEDKRTLLIPAGYADGEEITDESLYASVYDAKESDVMTEEHKGVVAAFHLVAGLKGFLNRTFPGARICCSLMEEINGSRTGEAGYMLSVTNREKEGIFVLWNNGKLLSASVHSCMSGAETAYWAFHILDVYGVDASETHVVAKGGRLQEDALEAFVRFSGKFTDRTA